jgi:PAS domain S-box-containing protein
MVFDKHITTKESGSGLGLFMTKKIIEQRFGGTITVENRDDGACFSIELPYAEYGEYFKEVSKHDEKLTLERINQLSRKVIELEDLEKTLKKWSDIFKQAHWGIAMHSGKDNAFELTNAAFNTLYGYTSEELKSIRVSDLFTPESLPMLSKIQKEAKKKGFVVFEAVHKRRDGSTFPASVELIVIKNDSGEVLYHIANVWDISEKKTAEKELLLVNKALNNTNEAVYIMIEDRFIQVNDGACKMLGYSREEFTAMRLCDIDPDFSEQEYIDNVDTIIRGDVSLRHERQHHTKEGRILDVEIVTNFFENEGITYSYSAVRDITEQKKAREELLLKEFALNTINEAVYLINEDSMFQYVNEGACEALGYTKEELLTMGVIDLDPNFPIEQWKHHWEDIKAQKTTLTLTQHQRKDGTFFPIEISSNYFEYNGLGYSLAVSRDITERLLLE